MAQAIVDPERLREFASALQQFDLEIQLTTRALCSRFDALGETWRDQEHSRFADTFQETMTTLRRFSAASEEHIPFLLRKAEAAEEYLSRT